MHPYPTSQITTLIIFFHLRLVIQSRLLTTGFPTKPCILSLISATCPAHLSIFYLSPEWYLVRSTQIFPMQCASLPCYLVPRRAEYPSQHPIPENPQPTILPQFSKNKPCARGEINHPYLLNRCQIDLRTCAIVMSRTTKFVTLGNDPVTSLV
jgi:hypothetical protein